MYLLKINSLVQSNLFIPFEQKKLISVPIYILSKNYFPVYNSKENHHGNFGISHAKLLY